MADRRRPPADERLSPDEPASERFRRADPYRARREWLRYEGTAQRDLFRQLRERFLSRHSVDAGWAVDLGTGPGRFLAFVGGVASRRVALDLSREMLRFVPAAWVAGAGPGPPPDRVLGDAVRPPLAQRSFAEVVMLGNALGFAGEESGRVLDAAEDLVAPGGRLVLEVAPGFGERSSYFGRLPPGSVARLLRAPVRAVVTRIVREGFRAETARRRSPGTFRRLGPAELQERWRKVGWEVEEVLAIAPVLGADAVRATAVRADGKAWGHLLEVEEEFGRQEARWARAAAVLLSVRRPVPPAHAYD